MPCRPAPPTGLSGLVSSHFTSALRCSGAGTYFCPSLFSVVGTQLPLPRLGCFPLGAWLTATCQGMPLPRGSPESGYISRPPAPVPRAPTTAVTEQPFRLPLSFQRELLGGRGHVNFPLSSPLRQHSARPKQGLGDYGTLREESMTVFQGQARRQNPGGWQFCPSLAVGPWAG